MNSIKKNLPRGYNEIYQFVLEITSRQIPEFIQNESPENAINKFLDSLFRRRLAVAKSVLDIMLEFENKDRELSILAWLLSKCPPEKSIKNIEEFLGEKQISDKLKRKLLLVLEQYNILPKISTTVAYFSDKEALAEYALNSVVEYIGADGDNLNQVFKVLANQELDFYHALTANLTYRTDEQSLWLLGMLAEFPNFAVAESAIQALGYRKSPLAYELLDNLIHHQNDVSGIRAKALLRLTQSGIIRNTLRLMSPHKCYLSWIDGAGNRMLLISRRTSQGMGHGRLFMVTFMLHEEKGVQDCTIWNDISTYEMESLIKNLETQTGLKQIDYTLGTKIIEDSLWKAIKNKEFIPPSFLVARRIFGSQKLLPNKYTIGLNDMGIQYVQKRVPELLQESEKLLEEHPFCDWLIDSREILDFSKSHPSILNGKKIRKDILTQLVKIILEPKREVFLERFLLTAEFLHKTSARTCREQIEICLAICLSLGTNVSLLNIPFMVGITQVSIQKIIDSTSTPKDVENSSDTEKNQPN